MLIRKGSKERELVKEVQEALGITVDGIFGPGTEKALMNYQKQIGLVADGIAGPKTMEALGILDTDNSSQHMVTENGLTINRHHLPKGEYIEGPVTNEYVFIHHTAGWNNPYKTINNWARDSRGRIATEFVIGGQNIKTGDASYDGDVVQAFPEGCWAYHLGKVNSRAMVKHSIGIEINSFGYLKNGKTYVGTPALEDQICTLEEPFRGFTQWHKYSDAQLESTMKLLEFIAERDNIDIREGLADWIRKEGPHKAFEFKQEACDGKVQGLLTHTNVRKSKFDNFPQPELCDMLLSL